MGCERCGKDHDNGNLRQKLKDFEHELLEVFTRVLKSGTDPISGVIKVLHERPENQSIPGFLVQTVLTEAFGSQEAIPGLIRILSGHVHEIIRYPNNVINIVNEHPSDEVWGPFLIKLKDKIKFEVGWEKGLMVLKNIQGLIGVEHGIEVPLERILVQPPKLIVTVKLGILHPQRVVDI